MSDHDTRIAEAIFKNEPYSWRKKDVRKTDAIAGDIQDYNPKVNDWPGIDTKGAPVNAADYEEQYDEGDRFVPSVPRSSESAGVKDYVNWYGKDSLGREVWSPSNSNTDDFERTWTSHRWEDGYWTIRTISAGSKLFRSSWIESFDLPINGHWFTKREIALRYNMSHYSDIKEKQVFPAFVKRSIDLIDMHDERNVNLILDLAKATDEKAFYAISDSFRLGEKDVLVYRHSTVQNDNIFCEWFKTYMGKFDGWIFLATPESGHHDEIFINEPWEVLERARYLVMEVHAVKWT